MMRIHCVGIGGIGLSGLAGILSAEGHRVSGSDRGADACHMTEKLRASGLDIAIGHNAKNLRPDADLVIHSLAVPASNPELRAARLRGISIMSYPEAVGELTRRYYTIAVCGTHGKSTITALIAKILIENHFDPTVIVGTKLKELNDQNFRVGKSKILVLEACEYKRAFLNYHPRVIVLHTLDPDHLDYYRNFEDYLDAFRAFVKKLPQDGYFFGNIDDEDVHEIFKSLQAKRFPAHNMFTYSTNYASSDFYLRGDKIIQRTAATGSRSVPLRLKIPGHHNRTNALAAFAVAATLGIAPHDIIRSLNRYEGSYRRFEIKGRFGKTLFIDDYAHHPAEIQATLQGAREKFPKEKICVVFQPHQYSRTKKLFKELSQSFKNADCVIVPNIYEVRDTAADKAAISPEKFVAEIRKHHKNVRFGDGIPRTIELLKKEAKKYDVVFTMGAGDVWKIVDALVKK